MRFWLLISVYLLFAFARNQVADGFNTEATVADSQNVTLDPVRAIFSGNETETLVENETLVGSESPANSTSTQSSVNLVPSTATSEEASTTNQATPLDPIDFETQTPEPKPSTTVKSSATTTTGRSSNSSSTGTTRIAVPKPPTTTSPKTENVKSQSTTAALLRTTIESINSTGTNTSDPTPSYAWHSAVKAPKRLKPNIRFVMLFIIAALVALISAIFFTLSLFKLLCPVA